MFPKAVRTGITQVIAIQFDLVIGLLNKCKIGSHNSVVCEEGRDHINEITPVRVQSILQVVR
jgi:hypothetical protein